MQQLDQNLWVLQYPLKALGANVQRHVTVMRLASGRVVVHSTGPFTPADVSAIKAIGPVGWVADVMLRHDTFSKEGRAAFPEAVFLGPEGFSKVTGFPTVTLLPAPGEWAGEIDVLKVEGIPSVEEHVFLHRPSRTLIVADLLFVRDPATSWWTRFVVGLVAGRKDGPGISRALRMATKDKAAFRRSLGTIGQWDFDRIIVGHGATVATDGKKHFGEAVAAAGI